MIKQVDKETVSEIIRFCDNDVFGTRIKAYILSYGLEFDYVRFYAEYNESGQVTACVSTIDGIATVSYIENPDEELIAFLNFLCFRSLLGSNEIAGNFPNYKKEHGYILEYRKIYENLPPLLKMDFTLADVYKLAFDADLFGKVEYLPWLSDATHRVNNGVTRFIVAGDDTDTFGCASVLFETDKAAVIGCVAVDNSYRNNGLGTSLVRFLGNELLLKEKRTEVLCRNDSIVNFYKKIGFEITGEWSTIYND